MLKIVHCMIIALIVIVRVLLASFYSGGTLDLFFLQAATSSKDEWQGKELGMRGGKPVHMLVHHSRNTAQKQWDETLVLVLGGMSRLLRPFLPFLQTLDDFQKGENMLELTSIRSFKCVLTLNGRIYFLV